MSEVENFDIISSGEKTPLITSKPSVLPVSPILVAESVVPDIPVSSLEPEVKKLQDEDEKMVEKAAKLWEKELFGEESQQEAVDTPSGTEADNEADSEEQEEEEDQEEEQEEEEQEQEEEQIDQTVVNKSNAEIPTMIITMGAVVGLLYVIQVVAFFCQMLGCDTRCSCK